MSQICSKMAIFLFSNYIGGHFCYHSNCKSQINARLLHIGYCFNKLIQKKFVGGGQNSRLMHIPLFTEKPLNTSLKDLSLALTNHGQHTLFSFLSSLPISVYVIKS